MRRLTELFELWTKRVTFQTLLQGKERATREFASDENDQSDERERREPSERSERSEQATRALRATRASDESLQSDESAGSLQSDESAQSDESETCKNERKRRLSIEKLHVKSHRGEKRTPKNHPLD